MANVTIKIPDSPSPVYTVTVNGVDYSYPSGKTTRVPDFVADVIRYSEDSKPKPGVPDYDPTGFTAHVRMIPGKESVNVAIDTVAVTAFRGFPNAADLCSMIASDPSAATAARIRAIFDLAEEIYVSESKVGLLPILPNSNAEVYAGGDLVNALDLVNATIYDLLKDKDNKSILIISDYPVAAEEGT